MKKSEKQSMLNLSVGWYVKYLIIDNFPNEQI